MYTPVPVQRVCIELSRASRTLGPSRSGRRLLTTLSGHMTNTYYKTSFPRVNQSITLAAAANVICTPTPPFIARTYTSNAMPEAKIQVGDTIPQGKFTYIPYTPALDDNSACGIPTKLNTDEWKGKKVVLVSVPGAFTPTCHANHLPPFLKKYDEFKAKGVDVIAVISTNDAFVLSGWARFLGVADKIVMLSDYEAKWSAQLGLEHDRSAEELGIRTRRYALIIDDLKVKYVGAEFEPGVTASGADAVLAAL
ncbi:Redoxin-domain-containing protein [Lenzites betulinus]|nr:Redoxin-domain-containing protein [Lenzites betulinus]